MNTDTDTRRESTQMSRTVKKNIMLLIEYLGLDGIPGLATYLGKQTSTIYNYINSPEKNSSIKSKLANLAKVTVDEFEHEDLEEVFRTRSARDDLPASSLVLTVYQRKAFSKLTNPADEILNDDDMMQAVRRFVSKNNIDIVTRIDDAVQKYQYERYQEALYAFDSVLLIVKKSNIELLDDAFFEMYFNTCRRTNTFAGVYALKDRILSGDLHDEALAGIFSTELHSFDRDTAIEILNAF